MSGQSVPSDRSSMVTFHVNPHQSFVPVKVVRVMLGDKEIPLDTPIPVEGMWMRNFHVTIQNVSSKAIVLCDIAVMFPETFAIASPVPSFRVTLGTPTKHSLMRKDGTYLVPHRPQPEAQLLPGALATLNAPAGADQVQDEA